MEYLKDLVRKSVMGDPREYDAYGVINEAFILHKKPQTRYIIFPQLYIPWNPVDRADTRGSVPDFGIGRYYDTFPHVRLQGGVEIKRALPELAHLPPAADATADLDLQLEIHVVVNQASHQAKAAVEGGQLPPNRKLL